MALKYADRVKETTTTTGTGTVTLAGAVTGYQSFAAIGDGHSCVYCIELGAEWEVGIGTYTASGTTLSRTTVIASSNSGSLVSFSAGTKKVFVTKSARNLGQMSEASMITAYEVDWSAQGTTTYSNGSTVTHSGYVWSVAKAATATVEIVNTEGLKFTRGTTDDDTFVWADWNTSGNGGIGLPAYCLGVDRARRGKWAMWIHTYAYNLPTSLDWSYAGIVHGGVYPYGYIGVRRARNTMGAPNNSTGSLAWWTVLGTGGDLSQAFMPPTISYADSPADSIHNGTEDVVCIMFNGSHNYEFYYGTWSSGWPTFESLYLGAEVNASHFFPPVSSSSARRARDQKYTRTGWGVGTGTNSVHAFTIGHFRITYWDP